MTVNGTEQRVYGTLINGNCLLNTDNFIISFGRYSNYTVFSNGYSYFFNEHNLYNSDPEQIPNIVRPNTDIADNIITSDGYYQFNEEENCIYFYIYKEGNIPTTLPTIELALYSNDTKITIPVTDIIFEEHDQYGMDSPRYGTYGTIIKECGYKYSGSISILTYIQKYQALANYPPPSYINIPTTVIEARKCKNDGNVIVFETYGYYTGNVPVTIWFNDNTKWVSLNDNSALDYTKKSVKSKQTSGTDLYCCNDCIDCNCAQCDLEAILSNWNIDVFSGYGTSVIDSVNISYNDFYGKIIEIAMHGTPEGFTSYYSPGGWVLSNPTTSWNLWFILTCDLNLNNCFDKFTSITYTLIGETTYNSMALGLCQLNVTSSGTTTTYSGQTHDVVYSDLPVTIEIAADSSVAVVTVHEHLEESVVNSDINFKWAINTCNTGVTFAKPTVDAIIAHTNGDFSRGFSRTNWTYPLKVFINEPIQLTIRSNRHGLTHAEYIVTNSSDPDNPLTFQVNKPVTYIYHTRPENWRWYHPQRCEDGVYATAASYCEMSDFASFTISNYEDYTIQCKAFNSAGESKLSFKAKIIGYDPVVINEIELECNNTDDQDRFRYPCIITPHIVYEYASHGVSSISPLEMQFATNNYYLYGIGGSTTTPKPFNIDRPIYRTNYILNDKDIHIYMKCNGPINSTYATELDRLSETWDEGYTYSFKIYDPYPEIINENLLYTNETLTLKSPYANILWKSINFEILRTLQDEEGEYYIDIETETVDESILSYSVNEPATVNITIVNHLDESNYYSVTL